MNTKILPPPLQSSAIDGRAHNATGSVATRQSNIELLRIVAMFLVLVVHADFWSLGNPTAEDFSTTPLNAVFRTLTESISIVCVNVFVMISGWFGIKPSLRSFTNFIFQCAFFLFGIYAFMLCAGWSELSAYGLLGCLCLTANNWFIKAYVALYILSPLLNAFLHNANKKQIEVILIGFYTFQTIFGWFNGAARFIEFGYSCFSFIGLYVLAAYLRIYGSCLMKTASALWIPMILANCILYYLSVIYPRYVPEIFNYVNPFVVIESVGLFALFVNWRIKTNKAVNLVARSCFAVFLLHTNPNVGVPVFRRIINFIYHHYDGIVVVFLIFAFLIGVYCIAIVVDQLRIRTSEYLLRQIPPIKFADLS